MRLIVVSAIDQRTIRRHQLNHRHIKALSEARCRKLRFIHGLFGIDERICPCLSGKVNVGPQPKVKNCLIFEHIRFSDRCAHMHQCNVAGTFHSSLNRDLAVSLPVVAVDIVICHM